MSMISNSILDDLRIVGCGEGDDARQEDMRAASAAAEEIERLRRERDEATRYAENLAVALSRHFPHVSQWKPLTGDLIGLLTQIDNMTAGLSPSCAALGEKKK